MLQALKVALWILPNLFKLLKEFKTLEILYKKKKAVRTQWKQENTFIY